MHDHLMLAMCMFLWTEQEQIVCSVAFADFVS